MKTVFVCLIFLSLTACVTQEKKAIDSEVSLRLSAKAATAISNCHSSQVMVEDGRPAGSSAGVVLGMDASMSTAPAMLSTELVRSGVTIVKVVNADTTVVVMKRIYLDQKYEAKKVNIVLEARVPGMPPKIIRGTETSIMWWGKSEESEKAMARVFQNTVVQLVAHLNASCAKS